MYLRGSIYNTVASQCGCSYATIVFDCPVILLWLGIKLCNWALNICASQLALYIMHIMQPVKKVLLGDKVYRCKFTLFVIQALLFLLPEILFCQIMILMHYSSFPVEILLAHFYCEKKSWISTTQRQKSSRSSISQDVEISITKKYTHAPLNSIKTYLVAACWLVLNLVSFVNSHG